MRKEQPRAIDPGSEDRRLLAVDKLHMRQRCSGGDASDEHGVGMASNQLEHLADDTGVLPVVALVGDATSATVAPTPPSTQSCAEIRTDIGGWGGQTVRIGSNTSSGERRRFSSMIDAAVSGSASCRLPSVWSEQTTPQPKVSQWRLAFDHRDVLRRIGALHEKREVPPRRAPADANDLH